MQMPEEIRRKVQDIFTKTSLNSGKAMKELAIAIKTMTTPSSSDNSHIANSKTAAETLKSLLKSDLWKDVEFVQVMPVATLASVLIEIILCVEKITESVHELALLAQFKNVDLLEKSDETKNSRVVIVPVKSYCPEVVIMVNGSAAAS